MLDSNKHCCSRAKTTMEAIIESGSDYKKKANIYDGRIGLYVDTSNDVMQVHEPHCKSGTIVEYMTLDDNAHGCITAETSRAITLASMGKPIQRNMLAIQAAMAQRLFINGLGQHRLMKGLLVKEYLAPDAKAFDKCNGNEHGPIKHYPFYPTTEKNRQSYHRRV